MQKARRMLSVSLAEQKEFREREENWFWTSEKKKKQKTKKKHRLVNFPTDVHKTEIREKSKLVLSTFYGFFYTQENEAKQNGKNCPCLSALSFGLLLVLF